MTADTLDVLLIEDNVGDARLVEEMLRDAQQLLHRIEIDGLTPERVAFHHELELAAGMEYLSEHPIDVILLDLGLPTSTGLETLDTVLAETEFTPVIVLTGLDDRDRGIQAIQRGAEDYLVKDDVTGELLIHSVQYAIEQMRQERERVRYREQLEALNELNTISQEITHDVITTTTREELEAAVCDRLVESDAYTAAWIGEVGRRSGELSPRAAATPEGFFDGLTTPVDEDDSPPRPEQRVIEERTLQVHQQPSTDEIRSHASEHGYSAIATIPVRYRTVFYGMLAIYARSPDAFSEHEAAILSRLGDVIGHAITAIERKNALISDTALELEFRLDGRAAELLTLTKHHDSVLEFDTIIRSDRGLLVYGKAEGLTRDAFQEAAEGSPLIDDLRILSSGQRSYEFEFLTSGFDALDTAIAPHGGHLDSATIANGEFRFMVEFPPGRDKRQLVDLIESNCEGATLRAHRTVQTEEPGIPDTRSVFLDRLTEKQRAALKTAYQAGYFEWPRATSGDEIAELLGITQATFSQHFRAAEREFFSAVFESDNEEQVTVSSPWNSADSETNPDTDIG
jgi:predicted DNA binding protein/DNA-binding NarL/FixJ family response regulator